MAELKEWIGGTTYDAANERPKEFNGKFPIMSFQEIIDIAKAKSKETGRVDPRLSRDQEPDLEQCAGDRQWLRRARQPSARGCPDQDHRGERPQHQGRADLGAELRARQPEIYAQPRPEDEAGPARRRQRNRLQDRQGRPQRHHQFAARSTGRWPAIARWFDAMLTPDGLAEIKTYADGIGPWKAHIVPLKIAPWKDKQRRRHALQGIDAGGIDAGRRPA